jgi:hypothetical protein
MTWSDKGFCFCSLTWCGRESDAFPSIIWNKFSYQTYLRLQYKVTASKTCRLICGTAFEFQIVVLLRLLWEKVGHLAAPIRICKSSCQFRAHQGKIVCALKLPNSVALFLCCIIYSNSILYIIQNQIVYLVRMSHQTGIKGTHGSSKRSGPVIFKFQLFHIQETSSLSHFSANAGTDIFEFSEFPLLMVIKCLYSMAIQNEQLRLEYDWNVVTMDLCVCLEISYHICLCYKVNTYFDDVL